MSTRLIPYSSGVLLIALLSGRAQAQLQSNAPPSPEYGRAAKPVYNPITAPIQLGNRSILSIDPAAIHSAAGLGGRRKTTPGATAPPTIMGFPNFGPAPKGFAGFPGQTGLPVPFAPGVEELVSGLAPVGVRVAAEKDAWPSWFDAPEAGKFTAESALLVRGADRVWYLSPEDNAFIPLAFHDRFRQLRAGSEMEVRHKGEFQVTFHEGGTLRTRGPIRMVITTLNEEVVSFALDRATRVWLSAKGYPYRLVLPDGSVVEALDTAIYFERKRDLLVVLNEGPGKLTIRTSLETIDLKPSNQIRLTLPERRHPPLATDLSLKGDLDERRTGRVLQVKGGARGGAVVWNGAQFRLNQGASLRVDPLAGDSFPENRKKNP